MGRLDASGVARLLTEYGQRLELGGENPYRARAYSKAAESLLALAAPLSDVIAQDRLRDIPGVGPAIAAKIKNLHESGTDPALEEMRRQVPAGVLEMLKIPGLRPRDVLRLHKELDVTSLDELENACRLDLLKDRKGLGVALQKKVLDGLDIMRRSRGQTLLHRATGLLDAAIANLRRSRAELKGVVAAGDVRRGCEVVSDLSVVALAEDEAGEGSTPLNQGIALHVAAPPRYGVALLLATGSADHVRELQAFAEGQGFTLGESGLRRGRRLIPCREESEVYAALGLPFIPPELREGRGEIALAAAGRLPNLVAAEDIGGLLHSHTNRSDGSHTLQQMAEATRKRGYAYFGVADHSQSAGYAGGLSVDEIEAQHAEIDRLNARTSQFRILKGIESDILADGSLDYPDDVLARFDFVVASVHSRFRLDERTQTARIVRAVSNPHTTIIGHMTGRMLLRRPGYEVDIDEVLKACAAHGVCVEINGNPHRLDLDWRWHGRALELGCMMSINPDAHSIAELDLTRWGVLMARKGGVPKERVLNCLSLPALTQFLEARKRSRAAGAAPGRRPARSTGRKGGRAKPARSAAKG